MTEQFSDFVTRERERLLGEREAIFTQQRELESKLTALNNEMRAIDAYEAAKTGKATPAPAGRARKASAPATTGRRGSKREGLLAVIKANPDGLARGEILEKMGLKGDKSGEMSVSNALTALTKNGQVMRGDDRKYRPGA
jgi:anti-sigma factor RsiW